MALVAAMNSGFDYYSPMPIQNSIESTRELRLSPINALQQDTPFEFTVEGSEAEDQFLDLSNSYFYFRVQVQTAANANPAAADEVSCIQNLGHSMFSRVEAFMQDRPVNDPHGCYGISSYITDLLQRPKSAKDTWMSLQGWWGKDTAGQFASLRATEANAVNKALRARNVKIGTGNIVELCIVPHIEIFHSDKFIPPGVKIKIRFTPAQPSFFMTRHGQNDNSKLLIKDAIWYLPAVKATHSQALALYEAVREVGPYRLNMSRTTVKTLAIAAGQTTGNLDNLILGPIPNRVVIAMMTNTAFTGTYAENTYNFQHFNVTNISLKVNGNSVPTNEYRPDFTTANQNRYKREYRGMLQALNRHKGDLDIDFEPDDFVGGYCFWVFDLTPDQNSDKSHSPLGSGNVRLDVTFGQALAAAIQVIIHCEFDAWIDIDGNKQVRTSFN